MSASIGERYSQVISMPTSSEDERQQRDTSDYEQGAVEEEQEEEEEETDYETDKQLEASGLSKGNPNNLIYEANSLIERLNLPILETKPRMMDYMMKC